jgi:hypothetical protein
MRINRGVVAAVAAVGSLAATAPAFGAATWTVKDSQTQSGHTITQEATARIVRTDADSYTIAVDCQATAQQLAAATGVTGCYLIGADGRRYNGAPARGWPGNKAATANVVDVPIQNYRVCVSANALFQDNFYMATTAACSS